MSGYTLLGPRWPTTTITWSFADPARTPQGAFSGEIGAEYQPLVLSAVRRWAAVSGLTLRQVDDAYGADVRIGWGVFGDTRTIGQASYSYYINGPFVPGVRVQMLDPAVRPLVADSFGALAYQGVSATLYQVALHEIGHALGLGHSDEADANMFPIVQSSNRDLDEADIAGIHALYPPAFVMQDAEGDTLASMGESTDGEVDYLQLQYIHAGNDDIAIGATVPNVFIKGGAGNDAIAVQSGRNVLDGGQGSNFLVGGTGIDTYFIDGRGGQATWGTVVGFQPGEIITLWGFDPAVSRLFWADDEGAQGYTGRTLHADLAGNGNANVLITIAGASGADTDRYAITTGQAGPNPYLAIINPA